MDLNEIINNNRAWVEKKLAEDSNFFKHLAQGQNPGIFYIGCSDSRIPPEEIMGLPPGKMFVHRNIANLVSGQDMSILSGIEFAVNTLKVAHIIICGHYSCGGIKFAMEADDLSMLNPWLSNIRDVYRLHQPELDGISEKSARYHRLVELNVKEQCINVLKTASAQKAYLEKKIKIHGWVFDLESGALIDLKVDFEKVITKIMGPYRLQ